MAVADLFFRRFTEIDHFDGEGQGLPCECMIEIGRDGFFTQFYNQERAGPCGICATNCMPTSKDSPVLSSS